MNREASYLILLALTPLITFLLHILVVQLFERLKPNLPPLMTAVWAIFISYFLIMFVAWQNYLQLIPIKTECFWAWMYGTLVYGGLSFSYFILFAMTESARRIHILRKLYVQGDTPLRELAAEYGPEDMLLVRLERMVSLRQLRREGNRYLLDRRLLYRVGVLLSFWSWLLGFSKGKQP